MAVPNVPNDLPSANDRKWEKQFAKLVAFKERFGHCRVSSRWPEDRVLGGWVGNQRQAMRRNTLKPERRHRLVEIGLSGWSRPYPNLSWDDSFALLVAFKERFGHCLVPKRWPENRSLGAWVGAQRTAFRRNILKPDSRRRLVEIGFTEWGGPTSTVIWEDCFARLVAFRARFGHCDVVDKWTEDPQLGAWVSKQCQFRKKGVLKLEYIRRLEELGFTWKNVLRKKRPRLVYRNVFRPVPPDLQALDNLWNKRLAALRNSI